MKKGFLIISLLLCLAMIFMGCGGKPKTTGSDNSDTKDDLTEDTEEVTENASEEGAKTDSGDSTEVAAVNSGKLTCITDLSEYWDNLYNTNEAAINSYEGMPILELVTPGLCFVTGVQYDILNIYNEDGRFDGTLMLAGYPGYEEKKGSQITFGYEYTMEEDSQFSNSKAGDKIIETGNCDLDKGYYFSDSYTDRAGAVISRSISEFQIEEDGSMCTLVIEGKTLNYNNEEAFSTTYIFIRNGKGQYDFAVGSSEKGTAYDVLHLEKDMTKEKAIALFEGAGATIEYRGGIKDGVFVLD